MSASVLLASAALLSVPTCSSLHGSLPAGGAGSGDTAFVPCGLRPPPRASVLGRGLCPLRPLGASRGYSGRSLQSSAGAKRRTLQSAAEARWTCQYSVGGGFADDSDAWGDDDLWEGDEGMDPGKGMNWQTVLLKDSKLDRTIECFVDREIEIEGKVYATLMPADTPVIMAGYIKVNGSQLLVPVIDENTIDKLFPTACAVLAEMDLTLSRSAVVLTVSRCFSYRTRGARQTEGLF